MNLNNMSNLKIPIIYTSTVFTIILLGGLFFLFNDYLQPPFGSDTTISNLQDRYDQSEIKAKYSLEKGALVREAKSDPKDRIEVVIGNKVDSELIGAETSFEPTIEISRWDEVNLKLIPDLSSVALEDRTLKFDKEKIIFETPKMDFEIYEYDEGMKYIWFLKEKPKSNVVEFTIQSKGLDFFYQPEVTDEEAQRELDLYNQIKAKGKPTEYTDEEWQKYIDSLPTTLLEVKRRIRPENVVGSYAVYMTKPGTNYVGGKEYKTGKFGHIYRPQICDNNNNCIWGDLFINAEAGIYRITIDQTFLDTAKYPIKCE